VIPSQPPFDEEPPWLRFARQYNGIREVMGGKLNPLIAEMFKATRFPLAKLTASTAWCAALVSHALERTGYPSPHTARAADCASFGVQCQFKPGAIVVLTPGVVGAGSSGHVGFYEKPLNAQHFWLFSGNCKNTAKSQLYPVERIVAVRWPGEALPGSVSPPEAA
jgi:uncharacterized protein (TIGR02594 family)